MATAGSRGWGSGALNQPQLIPQPNCTYPSGPGAGSEPFTTKRSAGCCRRLYMAGVGRRRWGRLSVATPPVGNHLTSGRFRPPPGWHRSGWRPGRPVGPQDPHLYLRLEDGGARRSRRPDAEQVIYTSRPHRTSPVARTSGVAIRMAFESAMNGLSRYPLAASTARCRSRRRRKPPSQPRPTPVPSCRRPRAESARCCR